MERGFSFFFCEIREVISIFPRTICVCWCFVFIVYVCFFVSCASIRFDDSKQFSLAVIFIMSSLFLFYIRYYNNFCDELYGRPFFCFEICKFTPFEIWNCFKQWGHC